MHPVAHGNVEELVKQALHRADVLAVSVEDADAILDL
jgi:hypothetical protein